MANVKKDSGSAAQKASGTARKKQTHPNKVSALSKLAAELPTPTTFLERQEQTLELVQKCKIELSHILNQKEQYAPRIDAVASALYKCNEIETSIYTKGSKQDNTETQKTLDTQIALYVGLLEGIYRDYLDGKITETDAYTNAYNFCGTHEDFEILYEMAKVNAKAINNGYVGELLGGLSNK